MEPSYQDYEFNEFKKKIQPANSFKKMINTLSENILEMFRVIVNSPKSKMHQEMAQEQQAREMAKEALQSKKHLEAKQKKERQKEKSTRQEQEKTAKELKQKLINLFAELVSNNDTKKMTILLEKGYELTLDNVTEIIGKKLDNDNSLISSRVNDYMKNQFLKKVMGSFNSTLSFEDYLKKFSEDDYHYYEDYDVHSEALRNLEKIAKSLSLVLERVDLKEAFEQDEFAMKFLTSCNRFKKIVNRFQKWDGADVIEDSGLVKALNTLIDHINTEKAHLLESEFLETLKEFDPLFKNDFDSMKKDIAQEMVSSVQSFSEQNLPAPSREVIAHIRENYQLIVSNAAYEKISMEDKLDLDNIYKKRFPQVLEEYITISPRYREKLIAHNESPDALLLDSLEKIKTRTIEIFETLEDSKINQMKVTNTYLKRI